MSVYRTAVRRGIVGVKPPPRAMPDHCHSSGSQPKNAMFSDCTNKYSFCYHSAFNSQYIKVYDEKSRNNLELSLGAMTIAIDSGNIICKKNGTQKINYETTKFP